MLEQNLLFDVLFSDEPKTNKSMQRIILLILLLREVSQQFIDGMTCSLVFTFLIIGSALHVSNFFV